MNSIFIVLALNWFIWAQLDGVASQARVSLVGTVVFLGIAGLSYFSWQSIAITEYRKIADQSKVLGWTERNADSLKP